MTNNTKAIIMANSAASARKRMWPSFETAAYIYDWANSFLLGALAVGVVSTGLVIWMGNIKETYLRKGVADAGERASVANARANEAELKLIEFRKSRRQLLAEPRQIDSFIEKIRPFSGTRFDIGHAGEGREQWDFL